MAALTLGIDTGGTFTDGVILNRQLNRVVRTAKVLTTHHDLRICIGEILAALLPEGDDAAGAVGLVSLSTTLATNAIVEGKARPVGLLLLGYDPELIYTFSFQDQLGTPLFAFVRGGMTLQGKEQAPLDESTLIAQVQSMQERVEALAVSSYAGTVNAAHEERASELIREVCDLPVVQGNHLTSQLNSIRRATTASLNAGLLSTVYDFLHTVEDLLVQRGIHCPLIIVRGDGSVVSARFAETRPVEIIHSGPATSAIGGAYLAGTPSAVVIDVGGTTTDLALIENGRPVQDHGHASVGSHQVSVRTIRARSFGLGGDSQIRFDPRGNLRAGPERVIPLAYLAQQYPAVKADLQEFLRSAPERFYSDRFEYWLAGRSPRQGFADPRTNRALELLQDGPKRMAWVVRQAGARSPVQVDGPLLARQDFIRRAGLTPTDLLHVTGEYAPWDVEMACMVVEASARMLGMQTEAFVQTARDWITHTIAAEVVHFLTGERLPETNAGNLKDGGLARWMFEENLRKSDPYLGCRLQMRVPLVGIGAPARAFLPPVARALGAEIIFPEHYHVANAVGTVVSSVLIEKEALVEPVVSGPVVAGYQVISAGKRYFFEQYEDALAQARAEAQEQALEEARTAGAEEPGLEVEERTVMDGMVTITARAVGKPGGVAGESVGKKPNGSESPR